MKLLNLINKIKIKEKIEIENKEKTTLLLKLEKEKKENKLINQKYQKLLNDRGKQEEEQLINELENNLIDISTPPKSEPIHRKLPKVNFYDIEEIALLIKYNLILNRIEFENIIDVKKIND